LGSVEETPSPGNGRDRLHELVEALPESELDTAERVLEALRDAMIVRIDRKLDAAPYDDEPDDDDFDGGLTEARSQESVPHEEVRRRILGQ
jgi:hypothetical protein